MIALGIYFVVLPIAFAGMLYWLFTSRARDDQRARTARNGKRAQFLGDARIAWRVAREDEDHVVLGARVQDRDVELRLLRFTESLHAGVARMPLHDGERIARRPLGRDAEDLALGEQENQAATIGESGAWVLWSLEDARARVAALPPALVTWLDAHAEPAVQSLQFDDTGAMTYVSANPLEIAAMIGPLSDVARSIERALA